MISKIAERLHNSRHIVENLCKEDDTFRSIYEDYLKCLDVQRYWLQSDSDDAAVLSMEYAELVTELENELIEIIKRRGLLYRLSTT